jgi:predicted  nucleic acid-binding Zn-ribbon protein
MDDRLRTIKDLDAERAGNLDSRERTLEALGKSLFERAGEGAFPGEQDNYRRYNEEIDTAEKSIRDISDGLEKIKSLNEEISVKKQEQKDRGEELDILLHRLGKQALTVSGDSAGKVVPFLNVHRRQLELCDSKRAGIESELRELDASKSGGFFSWIRGSAKSVMLQSSLKRNGKLRERIFREAGRKYLDEEDAAASAASAAGAGGNECYRDALSLSKHIAELDEALSTLENEKRKIEDAVSERGNPGRRLAALRKDMEESRGGLRKLFLKMGESAASGLPTVAAILTDADKAVLGDAELFRKNAEDSGREIERLEAAIAADKESGELAKLQRALDGKKDRLADDERTISELNRKIAESKEKLQQLKEKAK